MVPLSSNGFLRQAIRTVANAVTGSEPGRRMVYGGWRWLLEDRPALLSTPARAKFWYRVHFRTLTRWFEGQLDWSSGSALSAARCDEAFVRALTIGLETTGDSAKAREFNAIIRKIERARGIARLASFPQRIHIELVEQGSARRKMDFDVFQLAVPLFRYAETVYLNAHGAAPLHPRFAEMVNAACASGANVHVALDARLLDEPTSRLLVGGGVREVRVGMDAADAATFRAISGADDFDAVVSNLRRFRDRKSGHEGTCAGLAIDFVARRSNLGQLPALVRLAKDVGAESVRVCRLRARTPEEAGESVFFSQAESDASMRDAAAQASNLGVQIDLPVLFDDTGAPPASVATDPYAFLHVRADGALSPCGNGDTPAVEAGEEGFAGAWNSPVFREFRRGICAAGSIPECRACGVRGTRDPRTVDYLLASYDTGEPSGEYLAAVRAQLDALEDPATARALNAHVRGFEHWRGFVSLASYPHRMYIELTDECNLRCPMCTQSTLTGARKNMPMELFDKLRPLFRYTDMIHFTGCGEMFLHPQFRDMLSAAPNAEATVRIITNGLLLDEEMSRFLIAQKLKELWVSLDGVDSATFERVRKSKQFPRVLENIRTLVRLKRELGSVRPHVALNFVARRCNIEQLPDFVRMAENLGAESVNVGFLQVYSRDLASESLFFHQELSDRCMRMALDTAKETGVKVYLPGFFGGGGETEYRPLLTDSKCVEPYGFVYVRAEGTLGPCCVNDARLGLLAGNSFTDLWNGPEYRQFRRVVSTPEQDLNCQHCMLEGYKDIREVEHHLKLYNEANEVEDIDYEALAAQVANATS